MDSDSEIDKDDHNHSDNEEKMNPLSLFDIAGKNLLHLWTDGHLWADEDESNEGYLPSNKEIYTVMTLGKN